MYVNEDERRAVEAVLAELLYGAERERCIGSLDYRVVFEGKPGIHGGMMATVYTNGTLRNSYAIRTQVLTRKQAGK